MELDASWARAAKLCIDDHEVEVADNRRVEARIVDLAQAAAFQSKPNLAQGGVTRAEAAFVCRQPIGLVARTGRAPRLEPGLIADQCRLSRRLQQ